MTVEELAAKITELERRIVILEDLAGRDHGQEGADDLELFGRKDMTESYTRTEEQESPGPNYVPIGGAGNGA